MCGIVGLHLRTPELYPRLGELLTGMLCEMSNRGSDSAGVAVYGDPVWTPPRQGCVSLLAVHDDPEFVGGSVGSTLGVDVAVATVGDTLLLTASVDSEQLLAAAKARASMWRFQACNSFRNLKIFLFLCTIIILSSQNYFSTPSVSC